MNNYNDYIDFLNRHTHKFDNDGYCDLCGFHKDELLGISGIYQEPLDIGEYNE